MTPSELVVQTEFASGFTFFQLTSTIPWGHTDNLGLTVIQQLSLEKPTK